ncbi:M28 family metallopeptidase [Sediminibacterium soli]|uniref:M28 family metallopeptidase n=1 Tax=Sediminibacterium soli TaxID=2698829 RepID=UPI00137AFF9F|nr:M28 family metallopeptidase [Sediminibacterium soli]NCI46368.1 M28 family peptidase [Sediminibacterium soli]
MKTKHWLVASLVLIAACKSSTSSVDDNDGVSGLNKDSLVAEIKILASDSFQGRRPFSAGEAVTVDYLQKQFASIGLEAGNGGSYFQDVPMVEISPELSPVMKVQAQKTGFDLKKTDDYVIWTENTDPQVSLDANEVVFAGYGVVAPEYGWNDYAGIDVKNKVVMVLVNDPGHRGIGDSALFKGKAMTYYGRWTYKFEEAARQGAKGCLVIHNTVSASYPFSVVQNSWGKSQLHLDTRGSNEYRCAVEGWITEAAARKIITASGQDTAMLTKANEKGFRAVPLKTAVSTSMKVKADFKNSKNVIGRITGSKYPDEYLIYTAHWDHFGIGKPDAMGDSIYNGALDNASGTAALLQMARAFKSMKTKPERTVVFLAVTGEEQGLLGSQYYSAYPVYPVEKTLANINIDVINNMGKTRDFQIVGSGQSDLEDYLAEEAKKQGRYIAPEAHPEAGSYFRSDHFNFAKAGVPALTTESGVDDAEKGKAAGEAFHAFYTDHLYHQPKDEYDPARWNLDGAMQDLELLFRVGRRIVFDREWPKWKEGSEFKAKRK